MFLKLSENMDFIGLDLVQSKTISSTIVVTNIPYTTLVLLSLLNRQYTLGII